MDNTATSPASLIMKASVLGLLGITVLGATMLDVIPLLLGCVVFTGLVLFSFFAPEKMLLFSLFVAITVPVDAAFQLKGVFRIGPTRVVVAALMVGAVLRLMLGRERSPGRGDFPLLFFIVGYLSAGLLSCLFSTESLVSAYGLVGRDLLEQFFLFYLFFRHLKKAPLRRAVRTTLLAAVAVVALFGVYEAISQHNPLLGLFGNAQMEYREGMLRLRSVFFHPIAFGAFLNMMLPIALLELFQCKNAWRRTAVLLLIAVMLVECLLTVSRGPWISLMVETSIFLAWWGHRSIRTAALASTLLVFAVAALFILSQANSSFNRLFQPVLHPGAQPESSSEFYRITLVEAVVERLEGNRWIYGYGPNAFDLSQVETQYKHTRQTLTSPDNHFARLLLEYGGYGLCWFVALLAAALAVAVKVLLRAPRACHLEAVGCVAALAGFIAVNATVSLFQVFPLGTLFWLILALSVTLPEIDGSQGGLLVT